MQSWVVATTLAAVVVLGGVKFVELAAEAPRPVPMASAALVPVFAHVVADSASPGAVLAVWNATVEGGPFVRAPAAGAQVAAQGRVLASVTPAPPGPRFGRGGYNATALTFYAFTSNGKLIASDAPAQEVARFTRHKEYHQLAPVTVYLGAGKAANGTTALPSALSSFAPLLRDALAGQPVGGTVAVKVDHGIVASLYGPLTLAVRVDRLALAP